MDVKDYSRSTSSPRERLLDEFARSVSCPFEALSLRFFVPCVLSVEFFSASDMLSGTKKEWVEDERAVVVHEI